MNALLNHVRNLLVGQMPHERKDAAVDNSHGHLLATSGNAKQNPRCQENEKCNKVDHHAEVHHLWFFGVWVILLTKKIFFKL